MQRQNTNDTQLVTGGVFYTAAVSVQRPNDPSGSPPYSFWGQSLIIIAGSQHRDLVAEVYLAC